MRTLPPLASLIAFDALFRSGSVTGAARILGRTHSAVSKQLHQLQDHTGATLFEKRGSGIELTAQGRSFGRVVSSSLDDMRAAYQTLRRHTEDQKIVIKVSSTFARIWAIPTVARFNIDHPDIEVQISLTIPKNDHDADGTVDLVLSWDRLTSPMTEHPNSTTLGDVYIGPVLSPAYAHELTETTLRFGVQINRRGSEYGWERWSELTGLELQPKSKVSYDLSALTIEAAERSMGIALAPKFLIERELKSGSLVAPAGFLCFPEGLIVRPSRERPEPNQNAKVFLDWLSNHGRLGDDGFLTSSLIEPEWG